jgi:hypothetical protein
VQPPTVPCCPKVAFAQPVRPLIQLRDCTRAACRQHVKSPLKRVAVRLTSPRFSSSRFKRVNQTSGDRA